MSDYSANIDGVKENIQKNTSNDDSTMEDSNNSGFLESFEEGKLKHDQSLSHESFENDKSKVNSTTEDSDASLTVPSIDNEVEIGNRSLSPENVNDNSKGNITSLTVPSTGNEVEFENQTYSHENVENDKPKGDLAKEDSNASLSVPSIDNEVEIGNLSLSQENFENDEPKINLTKVDSDASLTVPSIDNEVEMGNIPLSQENLENDKSKDNLTKEDSDASLTVSNINNEVEFEKRSLTQEKLLNNKANENLAIEVELENRSYLEENVENDKPKGNLTKEDNDASLTVSSIDNDVEMENLSLSQENLNLSNLNKSKDNLSREDSNASVAVPSIDNEVEFENRMSQENVENDKPKDNLVKEDSDASLTVPSIDNDVEMENLSLSQKNLENDKSKDNLTKEDSDASLTVPSVNNKIEIENRTYSQENFENGESKDNLTKEYSSASLTVPSVDNEVEMGNLTLSQENLENDKPKGNLTKENSDANLALPSINNEIEYDNRSLSQENLLNNKDNDNLAIEDCDTSSKVTNFDNKVELGNRSLSPQSSKSFNGEESHEKSKSKGSDFEESDLYEDDLSLTPYIRRYSSDLRPSDLSTDFSSGIEHSDDEDIGGVGFKLSDGEEIGAVGGKQNNNNLSFMSVVSDSVFNDKNYEKIDKTDNIKNDERIIKKNSLLHKSLLDDSNTQSSFRHSPSFVPMHSPIYPMEESSNSSDDDNPVFNIEHTRKPKSKNSPLQKSITDLMQMEESFNSSSDDNDNDENSRKSKNNNSPPHNSILEDYNEHTFSRHSSPLIFIPSPTYQMEESSATSSDDNDDIANKNSQSPFRYSTPSPLYQMDASTAFSNDDNKNEQELQNDHNYNKNEQELENDHKIKNKSILEKSNTQSSFRLSPSFYSIPSPTHQMEVSGNSTNDDNKSTNHNLMKDNLSSAPKRSNEVESSNDCEIVEPKTKTFDILTSDESDKENLSTLSTFNPRYRREFKSPMHDTDSSDDSDVQIVEEPSCSYKPPRTSPKATGFSRFYSIFEKKSNIKQKVENIKQENNPTVFNNQNLTSPIKPKVENIKQEEDKSDLIDSKLPVDSKSFFDNQKVPDWEELSEAFNEVVPSHGGAQSLATFNSQKRITIDRLKALHGSLENCPAETVLAEDPKGLNVKLMDHQKHALVWMQWREKQKPDGGILADDMGLGKTLSMISLVLSCKNQEKAFDSDDEVDEFKNLSAWSSRGRKDYFDGGTLVICPASLVRQWESEVKTKVSPHRLTVHVHHGTQRNTNSKQLAGYDMVITTYSIVAREHGYHGPIFNIKWQRIILDEAHIIRNPKALCSKAACELKAKARWALTGTPIQNKEMDVYALLKFLHCTPFDDLAHWKLWITTRSGGQQRLNTIMKSLMLRRTKVQLQARGELQGLPSKSIELIEFELDKDEMNVYQQVMAYSRTLFAQFLLQRAERNADLVYTHQRSCPRFIQTKDSNDVYYKMHQKFTKLHRGSKEIKTFHILVLLLRLRQVCCHPGLIRAMLEDEDVKDMHNGEEDGAEDISRSDINLMAQLNKLDDSTDSIGGDDDINPEELAKASSRVMHLSNPIFDYKKPSKKMLKVLETLKERVLNTEDKAIVVSQWTSVLNVIKIHIEAEGVETLSFNGTIPIHLRQDIVSEFNDAASNKRILLLSLTAGGVGLNLVGANHLLLIDLHWNPQLEAQAQDRIYRVGQQKDVFIYKFMCKDTIEERIKALQDHKLAIADCVLTGARAVAGGSKLTLEDLKMLFGM